MVFMDYRFPLKAALETTYTDALGRPLLDIAGYNTFRQSFFACLILCQCHRHYEYNVPFSALTWSISIVTITD